MKKINRIDCLRELLEGIFNITTINYEDYVRGKNGTLVINKSGLFDKHKYSPIYKQKFEALFDIAFSTKSVNFYKLNRGGKTDLTRDRIINNAFLYLRRYGIDVPDYYENSNDRYMLSKLLYKVIVSEVLPVIFDTDNNNNETFESDLEDITEAFYAAINNIKRIFESDNFAEIMYANAIGRDIEFIYNRSEILDRCNYFKLFSTEQHYSYHEFNPYFMLQIKVHQNDDTLIISAAELKEEFFNSVIGETLSKGKIDNRPINLPKDDNFIYRFRILNSIHSCCFLPRFFYYAKEISKDALSSSYSDCSDKFRFQKRISDEAREVLHNKYRNKFDDEEIHFFRSIMEVLGQICYIRYNRVIDLCKQKADRNYTTNSLMNGIINISECLHGYNFKPGSIVLSIITAIDYSVDGFCDFIENYYFRSSKDQRTKSWNMGFLITALYDEERKELIDSIESFYKRIEVVKKGRGKIGGSDCVISKIVDDEIKLTVTLGNSDKHNEFVPFKALKYDPFERLQKILKDIVQVLKEE